MIKIGEKAQFQIGFGMIFSLILIAVFLVVAFIAINAFLGIRCSTEQGRLIQDINAETTRIWKGAGEDTTKEFTINGCSFTYICFYDSSKEASDAESEKFSRDFREYRDDQMLHNLFFYPRKESKIPSSVIKHIDMEKFSKNPYCVQEINDKVKLRFRKKLSEALVSIS